MKTVKKYTGYLMTWLGIVFILLMAFFILSGSYYLITFEFSKGLKSILIGGISSSVLAWIAIYTGKDLLMQSNRRK